MEQEIPIYVHQRLQPDTRGVFLGSLRLNLLERGIKPITVPVEIADWPGEHPIADACIVILDKTELDEEPRRFANFVKSAQRDHGVVVFVEVTFFELGMDIQRCTYYGTRNAKDYAYGYYVMYCHRENGIMKTSQIAIDEVAQVVAFERTYPDE